MKRIISLVLLLVSITSLVPVAGFATTTTETTSDEYSAYERKQIYKQLLEEKYGESGVLEEAAEYTWDYSQVEETTESQVTPR